MKAIKTRLALGLCLSFAASAPALASFDMDESCPWSSKGCVLTSDPVLAVDIDTRENLLRLTAEQRGFLPLQQNTPSDTATASTDRLAAQLAALGLDPQAAAEAIPHPREQEDRFVSRTPENLSDFFAALIAEPALTQDQRHALALARLAADGSSDGQAQIAALTFPDDSIAQSFRTYLLGANQFYAGDYAASGERFSALKASPQAWLAGTASYMLMRNALNASSQHASSGYGSFEIGEVDKTQAQQARAAAEYYLQTWPTGQYAHSAQGMLRRINWYLQDWNTLAVEYEQAMQRAATSSELIDLVAESDSKLISKDIYWNDSYFINAPDAPLLTFVQALRLMRAVTCGDTLPCVDQAWLDSIKTDFERHKRLDLWNYLRLILAFTKQDYATVESSITLTSSLPENNVLLFSEQVLLGNSLMAQKKWQAASDAWKHLFNQSKDAGQKKLLQAKLAAALVQNNEIAAIFAADSPITHLRYRSHVLKTKAPNALLRQQIAGGPNNEERTIALHTLLMRDLTAGRYADWLQDKKQIAAITPPVIGEAFDDVDLGIFNWKGTLKENQYYCASLDDTVTVLASKPTDAHALNCLAEFYTSTNARVTLDKERWLNKDLDSATEVKPLPGVPQPLALYQQVISDAKAEPEDKSYALYSAIQCYAPSSYNMCSNEEVDKAVRKAWFRQLKTSYPGSVWAQDLKYYW
ncbi:MAG TPA: hypothetical protein VJS14_01775 [Enterobacteriaceae bacterium]|nr:hypothetical protein [Enterobacteriaceae bacterium]